MTSQSRAQAETREAPIIALRSAAFGYADRQIVADVDLDVWPGDVIAVLGPNGSGKSTLVRGLLGLTDHLGGRFELFGEPAERFKDHARVGYVPQRHTLSSSVRATAEEVVSSGRLVRQGWFGRPSATDRQVIAYALDAVGLADRAGTDVGTLSGGQQRRVLIARALAAQPDVLLLDEPTAGVDAANQVVLAEVLGRLAAHGVTMLIVTHEMDAFDTVATRVLAIDRGAVVFDGDREAFREREVEILRHAHTHHHDDEMHVEAASITGAPHTGPMSGRRSGTASHR